MKVPTILQNHFYLFKSSIEAGMKISELLFCYGKKGWFKILVNYWNEVVV